MDNDFIQNYRDRLRYIILGTCNTIGCGSCGLEWEEEGKKKCSATELQSKIMDLEMENHGK